MHEPTPGTIGSQTGSSMYDKTSDKLSHTTEQVAQTAKVLSHKAYRVGEQVEERAKEVLGDIANTAKQHPLATLAIAAGLAFAVGALWKIRSSASQQSRFDALLAHFANPSQPAERLASQLARLNRKFQ